MKKLIPLLLLLPLMGCAGAALPVIAATAPIWQPVVQGAVSGLIQGVNATPTIVNGAINTVTKPLMGPVSK